MQQFCNISILLNTEPSHSFRFFFVLGTMAIVLWSSRWNLLLMQNKHGDGRAVIDCHAQEITHFLLPMVATVSENTRAHRPLSAIEDLFRLFVSVNNCIFDIDSRIIAFYFGPMAINLHFLLALSNRYGRESFLQCGKQERWNEKTVIIITVKDK